MTKQITPFILNLMVPKVPAEGAASGCANSEAGVESYNIIWTLTHADIVTKYIELGQPGKDELQQGLLLTRSTTGAYPTLKITL